ncbi:MAG: cytochrome P450 [Polaribacter sp.]|jgi:cytochrome P450
MKSHRGFIHINDIETAHKISLADGFRAPKMESHLNAIQNEGKIDLTNLTHVCKNSLFFMSEDRHLELRSKVLKHIGPAKMKQWEAMIDEIISDQIDIINEADSLDLIKDFTYPIYRKATLRLLGIRTSNPENLEYWASRVQELIEPLLPLRKLKQLENGFKDLIIQLKKGNSLKKDAEDDFPLSLLSELLNWDTPNFNDDDVFAAVLILYGGSINVSQTLANIIYHLLNAPDAYKDKASDSKWVKKNLEYLIKTGVSSKYIHRIATKNQDIGKYSIAENDTVILDLPAIHSNGCPYKPKPITTWKEGLIEKKNHLAFGHGVRYCVGAGYSRFIIQKAIPVLFNKFKNIQLDSKIPDIGNMSHVTSLNSLNVSLKKQTND